MKEINAIGFACPKPVMKTKEEVDSGAEEIRVRVDNEIAASNVTRFLQGQGFAVKREGAAPDIAVEGRKAQNKADQAKTQAHEAPAAPKDGSWALLLLSDKIGADSDGLGDALMKAFLGTVAQSGNLPCAIALMNEGVKMALSDRSTSDTLGDLVCKGVHLLICGTCIKHFGIIDDIKIGVVSNMFEITDTVFSTSKPIVLG